MQKSESNFLKWAAIGIFLIVCAGLYWLSHSDSLNSLQKEHPNIRIYTQLPSPTPASMISAATDAITSPTADLSAQATTVDSATTTIDTKATQSIFCTIHDALGEPIAGGNIQYGTTTIPFRQGQVKILDIASEPLQLTASADGYQSATQTVNGKESSSVDFTLEYTCSYEVQVFGTGIMEYIVKKNGPPQPAAEVTLYRAALCQRPLQHTQKSLIELDVNILNPSLYTCQYDSNKIFIAQSNMTNSDEIFYHNPDSVEFFSPQEEDVVLSVGSCDKSQKRIQDLLDSSLGHHKSFHNRLLGYVIPLDKPRSLNARMMDTLQLSLKEKRTQNERLEILLSRNNKRFCSKCLYFPYFSGNEEIINTATTNNAGKCHFDNLPPGLYYAQAQYNGQRSMIRPLLPASGGAQLCLDSTCALQLFTIRKDIPSGYHFESENIENVEITLQPKNSETKGFFVIKTNILGYARFPNIPFGQYTLTAVPPEIDNLSKIQMDIDLNRPDQIVNIEFDNWTQHDIEGTVVYYDTLQPIEGIHLSLYEPNKGVTIPGAKTITDKEGKFTFQNLPIGTYQIIYAKNPKENMTLCPYQESKTTYLSYPFYYCGSDDVLRTIHTDNQKTYTLQLKMIGVVATHLSGRVTDTNQKPIENAEIELIWNRDLFFSMEFPSSQREVRSNEKGFYEFTLVTRDIPSMKNMNYTAKLAASVYVAAPQQARQATTRNGDQFQILNLYAKSKKAAGGLNLPLTIGVDQKNLNIVVSGQDMFAVEGKIRTEDGCIPEDAKVSLNYTDGGNETVFGEYKKSGDFIIKGVENREFLIGVDFAYGVDLNNPNQTIEYLDVMVPFYRSQVNEFFARKESGENLNVEITLKKTGYLAGIVLDFDKKPIEGIMVRTNSEIGKSQWAYTDNNGKFRISQLKTDQKYPLFIAKGDSQPVQALSEIQANTENIILQWKDEKTE